MVCALIYFAAYFGRKENKHGPHLLAFTLNDIAGNGIQQRNRAFHRVAEMFLKLFDIRSYGSFNLVDGEHTDFYLFD